MFFPNWKLSLVKLCKASFNALVYGAHLKSERGQASYNVVLTMQSTLAMPTICNQMAIELVA
jgi:hypothetical protein